MGWDEEKTLSFSLISKKDTILKFFPISLSFFRKFSIKDFRLFKGIF